MRKKIIVCVLLAGLVAGCSFLSNTTPVNRVSIRSNGIEQPRQGGTKLAEWEAIEAEGIWSDGTVHLIEARKYENNGQGAPLKTFEYVEVIRTDSSVNAADVAKYKAKAGQEVAETAVVAGTAAGVVGIAGAPAISGLPAILSVLSKVADDDPAETPVATTATTATDDAPTTTTATATVTPEAAELIGVFPTLFDVIPPAGETETIY